MARTDLVELPSTPRLPVAAVARRIGLAVGLVLFVTLVVRLGRDGYADSTGDPIGVLDALYYASVTVTTTGYGDITAVSSSARAATILLITPARILFLILVVSTTVEVLTEQSRDLVLKRRWRKRVKDHIVVCGYGSTGQAAVADLVRRGIDPSEIVAVDESRESIRLATSHGLVGIVGDATRTEVLEQAAISSARSVIVAPNRDDTAVLITLTVREHNTRAHLVAGGREQENLHLLRQGGADEVIDATAAVGRMLGLGTKAPAAVRVLDELLDAGEGLELVQMTCPDGGPDSIPESAHLIAVIRDGSRLAPAATVKANIRPGDQLVLFRESTTAEKTD